MFMFIKTSLVVTRRSGNGASRPVHDVNIVQAEEKFSFPITGRSTEDSWLSGTNKFAPDSQEFLVLPAVVHHHITVFPRLQLDRSQLNNSFQSDRICGEKEQAHDWLGRALNTDLRHRATVEELWKHSM